MTRVEDIEQQVMDALRRLNKNVPVSASNQTDMLILAAYLDTASIQLRRRVRDFRDRQASKRAANDNDTERRMSH